MSGLRGLVRRIPATAAAESTAFFVKQVQASVFPLFIFIAGGLTNSVGPGRYDVLLVACLAMQAFLYFSKWETARELAVIGVFHVLGLALELYKVHHGSWQYPGDAVTKVFGVPLFSGFMYASIASYVMQAWRRFELEITGWPIWPWVIGVCAAIYANFFLNRFFSDTRWWIVLGVAAAFWRTSAEFTTLPGQRRSIPLVAAFCCIGFFVWTAEQFCTLLRLWSYPNQLDGWTPVGIGKLSSWCLLVIVAVVPIAWLKGVGPDERAEPVRR